MKEEWKCVDKHRSPETIAKIKETWENKKIVIISHSIMIYRKEMNNI